MRVHVSRSRTELLVSVLLIFKGMNLKDAKNICNKPLRAVPWLGQLPSFLLYDCSSLMY